MRPLQFPRTRMQTLLFLWTEQLLPPFPRGFLPSKLQARGVRVFYLP